MAALIGDGKPMADFSVLNPIETAPRGQWIIGAWVSITGRVMKEQAVRWFNGERDGIDDEDCPVNIAQWRGWVSDDTGCIVFPSHWRPIDA